MILSIHQPSYWPWLGLLDKIAKTDTFVLLDDVQVTKGTFQYRNIFFCNGVKKIITLPINYSLGITFNKLEFKNGSWPQQHLDKLRNYYLKTPFFSEVYEGLIGLFKTFKEKKPIDVLIDSMLFCFHKLGVRVNIIRSSSLDYDGQRGDMVLDICKEMNTDIYLAGRGSLDYMQEYLPLFKKERIEVIWHNFKHPKYPQHPKFKFVEGLSYLDILFFNGVEKSRQIFWDNVYSSQKNSNKKE